MSSKKRKLRLVTPRHGMPDKKKRFRCGETIPESGIYRVVHDQHRLPHEVTLLGDQVFPRCIKCDGTVYFELVRGVPDLTVASFKVALYALPADEDQESVIAS